MCYEIEVTSKSRNGVEFCGVTFKKGQVIGHKCGINFYPATYYTRKNAEWFVRENGLQLKVKIVLRDY